MTIEFENKPLEWGVEGVEPSEEKKAQGFANSEAPAAGHWDYKFRSDFLVQKELQEKVSELSEQGIDTSKLVTEEEFMSHKTEYAKLLTDVDTLKKLRKERSNKDSNGIFTTVTYKRKSDGTIYAKSVLSGGTSPNYTTKTETFYGADGATVIETNVYTVSYDSDGDWIGEV